MGRRWDVAEESAWAQWGREHFRSITRLHMLRRAWPLVVVVAAAAAAFAVARTVDVNLPSPKSLLRLGAAGFGLALAVYIVVNIMRPRLGGYGQRRPTPALLALGLVAFLILSLIV